MYSLILMAAVASGPEAEGFGGKWRSCHGCCGAYYSACYGCCGYNYSCCGYASCYGGGYYSCYGCYGGHHHKPLYYGYGCYACYGSCYGSWYGSSCYGSCYGYGYSCSGGCCGGYMSGPYTGGIIVESAPVAPEATPATPSTPSTPPAAAPKANDNSSAQMNVAPGFAFNPVERPALLTVELPEGAKLFVDGQATRGEGNVRKFHTPSLPAGKSFYYELKAEITINGQTEVEEKRVIVKAGETLSESFPRLIAAAKGESKNLVTASR